MFEFIKSYLSLVILELSISLFFGSKDEGWKHGLEMRLLNASLCPSRHIGKRLQEFWSKRMLQRFRKRTKEGNISKSYSASYNPLLSFQMVVENGQCFGSFSLVLCKFGWVVWSIAKNVSIEPAADGLLKPAPVPFKPLVDDGSFVFVGSVKTFVVSFSDNVF